MAQELSQQIWGRLADGMSAGLILVDDADRYVYANLATERLLGIARREMLGHHVKEVKHAMRMPLLLAMDMLKHGSRSVVTGRFPIKGLVVRGVGGADLRYDGGERIQQQDAAH